MEEKQTQHSTSSVPSGDFLIRTSDGSFLHSAEIEQLPKIGERDLKAMDGDGDEEEERVEKPKASIRLNQEAFTKALQETVKKSGKKSSPLPAVPAAVPPQKQKSSGPVSSVPPKNGEAYDVSLIADRLLQETNTTLPEEHFHPRFESIIDSRMREVRDAVSFTDMITRGVKIGGLGIDPIAAVKMSRLLDEELNALHGRLSPRARAKEKTEDAHPGASAQVVEQLRAIQAGKRQAPVEVAPRTAQTLAPALTPLASAPPSPPSPPPPPLAPPSPPRPETAQPLRIRKILPENPDRPKIEDIRHPQRLVGPVEELKILTLTDFRRLGANIEEMKENLLERFDLLREDSLTRLHEGIKAWKESEVYATYIDMGRESMESGKTIANVVLERSQANRPYLSQEEFDMMSEVNSALRS